MLALSVPGVYQVSELNK